MRAASPSAGLALSAVVLLLTSAPVAAQGGHGPAFGLATPTGGKGAVSYDVTSMAFGSGGGDDGALMLRHTWKYSLTERVQVNLSLPTPVSRPDAPPRTRGGSLMPGFGDLEVSALWRVHKNALDVGSRFESTLILGASHPTEERRGGVRVGNGLHAAAVTGYASRTVYFWAGAGTQSYGSRSGDRLGRVDYLTGVFGWRPPIFRQDYPRPDWRIFLEAVGERAGEDRSGGGLVEASGGEKVLVGPSVLGLYGVWGLSAGVLVPVHESLRHPGADEPFRAVLNLSYWF